MRFALIFVTTLCAPLVSADAAADATCLRACLPNVLTSGNQTQEVLTCVDASDGASQSTIECFCSSDPLIDQLTACVKNKCDTGVFKEVQKACDSVGVRVPGNSAVATARLSLSVLIATGIALVAAT